MAAERGSESPNSWDVLTVHNWDGSQSIETSLSTALDRLDGGSDESILYDHIDAEAITDAFDPERGDRGASEIRFDYHGYEVRLTRNGTIAVR
jgi:hypothetical protein